MARRSHPPTPPILLSLLLTASAGCTIVLGNDFTYPDGGADDASIDALDVPRDTAMDAMADTADASADAGECAADGDCVTGPPGTVGRCVSGTCSYPCAASHEDCDGNETNGCEIDTSSDRDHCGACTNACGSPDHASPSCVLGECRYECASGYADCDGASPDCETMLGTASDCMGCGMGCGAGEFCDTSSAPSRCADRCDPPNTVCGTSCVNVATSVAHCGGCGMPCGGGDAMWACVSRSCVVTGCDMGYGDCDADDRNGCEVDLNTSLTSCGTCGRACAPAHATGVCSTGSCAVDACDAGWEDCDGDPTNGCEVDLNALGSCGGCGVVCAPAHATPVCAMESCDVASCDVGWDDCGGGALDGCETNVRTLIDCGGCGVTCARAHAAATCGSGSCAIDTCDEDFANCNAADADGCEASLGDDERHCGACGHVCSGGTECVTGTCDPVIDVGTYFHGCAVRRSGIVECWGPNEAGQLGDGTLLERGRPAPVVGALRFDRIGLGSSFTCGIERGSGRLHCWGRNLDGELGDGTLGNRSSPGPVTSADPAFAGRSFVDLVVMTSAACAVDTTGEVWCWGRNTGGEVGNGTTVRAASAVRVAGLTGVLELGASHRSVCARTATGVRCWGDNAFGQLGDGSTMTRSSPVAVVGLPSAVSRVTVGTYHACVLSDDAVWCWGRNDAGELGRPGGGSVVPVDNGVRADRLVCRAALCFARTTLGWVGWGENGSGELGAGTETPPTATPIALPHATTSTLFPSTSSCAIDATGRLSCWGADWNGGLGVRDLTLRTPTRVGDGADWTSIDGIATGGFHSFVLRGGRAYAAGLNNTLALGRNVPYASAVPLEVTALPSPVTSIDAGRNFACAVAGTTPQLYCWGSSAGIASGTVAVVALPGTPLEVGAATSHVCAIVAVGADRVPYCWGANPWGQIGNGATGGTVSAPSLVAGITDAAELALGDAHTCVRRTSGSVACWGYGLDGRLGDGTNTSSNVPVVVSGLSTAIDIAAGGGHSCAARMDGRLVCWGLNNQGQLGDGGASNAATPRVATLLGTRTVTAVAAGGLFGCAVADGSVHCWGSNTEGQLGLGSRAPTSALVSLGLSGAVELAASHNFAGGAVHTCARMGDGSAYCWGLGSSGRLATGEDLTIATPMPVLLTH